MTARKFKPLPPDPRHLAEVVLPSGKRLVKGTEFSVARLGRFSFRYGFEPDGSITAFGPISSDGRASSRALFRSFRPDQVRVVHRPRQAAE